MWRDPFEEMKKFQREMNRLFNTFWTGFSERALPEMSKSLQTFREPLSDLKETNNDLIASIEIPGVDKKDIQLSITENGLEIKAEKKTEAKVKKEGYLRAERSYKGFYRSMNLPCKVIPEKATALYKDGVLKLVMPKAEKKKVKKAKKIKIQ